LVAASYVIGLNYRKVSAKSRALGILATVLLASAAAYLLGTQRGDWVELLVYQASGAVGLFATALVVDIFQSAKQTRTA
jgi:ABC-type lipoprotein release transport system permease subunit